MATATATKATTMFGREVRHRPHLSGSGDQWLLAFPNGYGASVIRSRYSYGGAEGKFELAVLHGDDPLDAVLCYATPVTEDVLGWLEDSGVRVNLAEIEALSANATCSHRAPR